MQSKLKRKAFTPHLRLTMYEFLPTHFLLSKVSKLDHQERDALINSGIACKRRHIKLNISSLLNGQTSLEKTLNYALKIVTTLTLLVDSQRLSGPNDQIEIANFMTSLDNKFSKGAISLQVIDQKQCNKSWAIQHYTNCNATNLFDMD